jgi:DNA-binding transcriptional regulator YiaG
MLIADKTVKIVISKDRPHGKKILMRFISFSNNALKDLRKEFEITQKELADALGVTQSFISQLEKGQGDLNCAQMAILGNFLSDKAGYKIILFADHEWGDTPQDLWGVSK